MDSKSSMNVSIILDKNFGIKLLNLPVKGPIWICESPANTRSAVELEKNNQASESFSVTTFAFDEEDEVDELLMDILYDVVLGDEWKTIDVYGVEFKPGFKSEIAALTEDTLDAPVKMNFKPTGTGFKIDR